MSTAPILVAPIAESTRGESARQEHGAAEEFAAIMAGLTGVVVQPKESAAFVAPAAAGDGESVPAATASNVSEAPAAPEPSPTAVAAPAATMTLPEMSAAPVPVRSSTSFSTAEFTSPQPAESVMQAPPAPAAKAAATVRVFSEGPFVEAVAGSRSASPIAPLANQAQGAMVTGVAPGGLIQPLVMDSLAMDTADESVARVTLQVVDDEAVAKLTADVAVVSDQQADTSDNHADSDDPETNNAFKQVVTKATEQACSMLLGEAMVSAGNESPADSTAAPAVAATVSPSEPPSVASTVRIAGTEFQASTKVADNPAAAPAERVRVTTTTTEATPNGRVVTVRFTSPDGAASRIRVAVVGETVHATILADAASAAGFERALPELRKSLGERGFNEAHVSVRIVGGDGAIQLRSDTATARDTNHRQDERSPSRQRDFAGDDRPRHSRRDRAEEEQA